MEDDTWQPGTVARVHVEHEGGTAPFAVQLDRGDAVIAPADEERFIRPLGGLRFRVGDRHPDLALRLALALALALAPTLARIPTPTPTPTPTSA